MFRNHSRRVRIAAGGTLGALLLIAPTGAYAAGMFSGESPPAVRVAPADVASPSDAPSATDAATPADTPAGTAAAPAPDGRIKDPDNATLPLPTWQADNASCPSGPTKFVKGRFSDPKRTGAQIVEHAYGDIDGDGAQETVVLVRCWLGEAGPWMVVAFDKDADGGIVRLGKVVESAYKTPIQVIGHVRTNGKAVQVQVGDHAACCGTPQELTQWQWRSYTRSGTTFTQTGGPTSFPANPHITNFKVTAAASVVPLVKDPSDPTRLMGTITFTVHNDGPQPTKQDGRIAIYTPELIELTIPQAGCAVDTGVALCPLTLAVGETKTFTMTFSALAHAILPIGYPGLTNGDVHIGAELALGETSGESFGGGPDGWTMVTMRENPENR